jgi:hypothetical protein
MNSVLLERHYDDTNRPASQDSVRLRPVGRTFAPGGPAAAGTALPDADPELFAARRAGRVLLKLATRSTRELPGAARLCGQDPPLVDRSGSGRRHDGDQSVRFLSGTGSGLCSVRLRSGVEQGTQTVLGDRAGRASIGRAAAFDRSVASQDGRFPGRLESATARAGPLLDPLGAGRADVRRDARARFGLVPRFGLAAGPGASSSGLGRAFRLGLSGAIGGRRQAAGRPGRPPGGFHGSARLGRGVLARCRLDRSRSHVGAAGRRRPHSAGVYARSRQRGSDHRQRRAVRDGIRPFDVGPARPRRPARDQALHGRAVDDDSVGRAFGRRASDRRRRASDDGRRTDLCVDRRHAGRCMADGGAGRGQAAFGRPVDPAVAQAVRAGRRAASRAGQVVSGRNAAALGVQRLLANRRAAAVARRAVAGATGRQPRLLDRRGTIVRRNAQPTAGRRSGLRPAGP